MTCSKSKVKELELRHVVRFRLLADYWPKVFDNECFYAATAAATAAKSLQSCLTLCDPIDSSPLAPPSLGFSRQEHWSGLPFPSPMHESEK